MNDLIRRQDAIDVLSLGKEIFSRVLDNMDVVGTEREKYSLLLRLVESDIKDIEELPSADAIELGNEYNVKDYTIMVTTYYEERKVDERYSKLLAKEQTFKVEKK